MLLKTLTEENESPDAVSSEHDISSAFENKRVRLFKTFPLVSERAGQSLLAGIRDERLVFCETHGIMRVTESIVGAGLGTAFNQGLLEKYNANLTRLKIP